MRQKDFEIVATIAARKAQFYENVKSRLLDSLPAYVNRTEADLRLRRAIAHLDNMLFVSDEEKATKMIKAGLDIPQLNLDSDKILGGLMQGISNNDQG